ncbi:MAG: hypothetical protein ABI697_04805 [Devosia sp.]
MSQAFVRESGAAPLLRSSQEAAEAMAAVYRTIEPDFVFEVRQGRGGWQIARLKKDGAFESWVEE